MPDRTQLTLTLYATHDSDRDGIRAALSAQGLEDGLEGAFTNAVLGDGYTAGEVVIDNGTEHRTLAEALVANTRHTAFELVHYPDRTHLGRYAAYAPGHDLYFAFCDVDGDPYSDDKEVARWLASAPKGMTVADWLTTQGPGLLGTSVRAALAELRA
ncbi:hypothetical protein AB0942_09915 [Streptomyces nodosus]|uniref:hypothetical protein n=1 Tax=Streptomyces nodosus TaxID=40318 RepID=UPI0034543582